MAAILMVSLGITAFAETSLFVGSIEAKTAPEVIEITVDDKVFAAIVIDDESDETVFGVPMLDENGDTTILEFVVISAAEKSEAALDVIKENITNSENQIKSVNNLGELTEGLDKKIEAAIDVFYGDAKDKIELRDLVISDLFDASLVRDKDHLEQVAEGQKVRFMMKPNFTKNDFFVLLHNTDGTNWEVVEDVEWTEEGNLIVTVDKLSVFAVALERTEDLPVDPNGPASPQTGDINPINFVYIGIAVLCVAVAVYFFVKSRKVKAK